MHRHEGFDAVECEIAKLQTNTVNLCAPDPIYPKLASTIIFKSIKVGKLLARAETSTKFQQALLNKAVKQLTFLRNRFTKAADRGKITPACFTKLDTLVARGLTLVQGLATP